MIRDHQARPGPREVREPGPAGRTLYITHKMGSHISSNAGRNSRSHTHTTSTAPAPRTNTHASPAPATTRNQIQHNNSNDNQTATARARHEQAPRSRHNTYHPAVRPPHPRQQYPPPLFYSSLGIFHLTISRVRALYLRTTHLLDDNSLGLFAAAHVQIIRGSPEQPPDPASRHHYLKGLSRSTGTGTAPDRHTRHIHVGLPGAPRQWERRATDLVGHLEQLTPPPRRNRARLTPPPTPCARRQPGCRPQASPHVRHQQSGHFRSRLHLAPADLGHFRSRGQLLNRDTIPVAGSSLHLILQRVIGGRSLSSSAAWSSNLVMVVEFDFLGRMREQQLTHACWFRHCGLWRSGSTRAVGGDGGVRCRGISTPWFQVARAHPGNR